MPEQKILIESPYEGKRIDLVLAQVMSARFSRSQIKKMIENGQVLIRERKITPHHHVKTGEIVEIHWGEEAAGETRAEDIPIDIIYEDEEVVLVNKPPGMVVHPAHGNPNHTLVNALLYHFKGLSSIGGAVRPGLVHRLDKDTSGIMVIAKNDRAHAILSKQFKNHTIDKKYYVIVRGLVQHDEGIIEEPVGRAFLNRKKVIIKPSGGKDAITFYRVSKRFKNASLVEVYPKTGRTHQIRVHMAHLNHPVLGDSLYGLESPWISRQALHAFYLKFAHPRTREIMSFECPMPEDMNQLIRHLEQELG